MSTIDKPSTGIVTLKHGREKPLRQRHPWVFSGAIDKADADPGTLVVVRSQAGEFLAQGYYNPRSQIVVRALSWREDDVIDASWWRARLQAAIDARAGLATYESLVAYRLVYAESDGLPGLIVDRYGDYLVIQSLTLGIEAVKPMLIELLVDLVQPKGIIERSDVDVRKKEGLEDITGLVWGEPPPEPFIIREYGLQYPVDLPAGHKTGFYLDQRENRRWLLGQSLEGQEVLNAFSYTGSFSACAALRGARQIVNVDSSQAALDAARDMMALNDLDQVPAEYVAADVFEQLRVYREEGRTFDLIILDPPKFAHSSRDIERAARGYKDINLLAFRLLRPGGLLLTFSCSGLVRPDLFQKIVFAASIDVYRQAQIIGWLGQGSDHPVLLTFPEGQYLKGLVCRVLRHEE
ncbi:MAG: class I SAM-dependent rRNA methyltransferase [Anaerolineae bacterium]|nr:class I SAM-dependent rRNA methyltransferase [Anaerolineae bacterium]